MPNDLPSYYVTGNDPDYDDIDYLIDNDPIELGRRFRKTRTEAVEHVKALLALLDSVPAGDWGARTRAEAFIASLHHLGRCSGGES